MADEILTRLYDRLLEALRERGHPPDAPVKVAQLYEELVPYRRVRAELGLELNADYEHALLRLLAGERDLLRVEPPETREKLRAEAAVAYPAVGLFRKFPDSDVWVAASPGAGGAARAGDDGAEAARGSAAAEGDIAGAGAGTETGAGPRDEAADAAMDAAADAAPGPAADADPAAGPGTDPAAAPPGRPGSPCVFCGDRLPAGQRVRFCPYCGGDQRLRPCPRCGAVLEREWRFCIGCGDEVSTS